MPKTVYLITARGPKAYILDGNYIVEADDTTSTKRRKRRTKTGPKEAKPAAPRETKKSAKQKTTNGSGHQPGLDD